MCAREHSTDVKRRSLILMMKDNVCGSVLRMLDESACAASAAAAGGAAGALTAGSAMMLVCDDE